MLVFQGKKPSLRGSGGKFASLVWWNTGRGRAGGKLERGPLRVREGRWWPPELCRSPSVREVTRHILAEPLERCLARRKHSTRASLFDQPCVHYHPVLDAAGKDQLSTCPHGAYRPVGKTDENQILAQINEGFQMSQVLQCTRSYKNL